MNEEKRALKASQAISMVRDKVSEFSYSEFITLLRKEKCPYVEAVIPILIKFQIIKKEQQVYKFTTNKDVYVALLKPGLEKASSAAKKSNNNYKLKHMGSEMQTLYEESLLKNEYVLIGQIKSNEKPKCKC